MYFRIFCLAACFAIQTFSALADIAAVGLEVEEVAPGANVAVVTGLVVKTVAPGSAGDAAGLQTGDVIVSVAAQPILEPDEMDRLLDAYQGTRIAITRIRGDEEETVFLTVPKPAARTPTKRRQYRANQTNRPAVADANRYSVVDVFYGTNRNRTGTSTPQDMYGVDRGELVLGMCQVTIPAVHEAGELEQPSILRLEFSEDPNKHVVLATAKEQAASEFYQSFGATLNTKGNAALIFMHGYNVSFKDAALRTAQLSFDLKFQGVPVFFSWPSQARYLGYTVDESNIEYSQTDLRNFIKDLVANTQVESIYLIAHSMGSRAMTAAVIRLLEENPDLRPKVKEIILAAPDIDADYFRRDIAPAMAAVSGNLTLYASSRDWALRASKQFHGYPRLGESGAKIFVMPGIATIDSSAVDTGLLGHSYFAESGSIISDIAELIAGRRDPSQRPTLVPKTGSDGSYWQFQTSP